MDASFYLFGAFVTITVVGLLVLVLSKINDVRWRAKQLRRGAARRRLDSEQYRNVYETSQITTINALFGNTVELTTEHLHRQADRAEFRLDILCGVLDTDVYNELAVAYLEGAITRSKSLDNPFKIRILTGPNHKKNNSGQRSPVATFIQNHASKNELIELRRLREYPPDPQIRLSDYDVFLEYGDSETDPDRRFNAMYEGYPGYKRESVDAEAARFDVLWRLGVADDATERGETDTESADE